MTSGDSVIGYVRVFGLSRLTRPSSNTSSRWCSMSRARLPRCRRARERQLGDVHARAPKRDKNPDHIDGSSRAHAIQRVFVVYYGVVCAASVW